MPLKMDHHWPISETPLKWCFAGAVECWLGSFVIFRGSESILLGNPIFCDFSGGYGPPVPLWIHPWHASERRYLSEMFRDHWTQSRTRL